MRAPNLLQVGIVGSITTALCCFTPALVVVLGAIGLSALVGYLDYVLLPALAFFLGLTLYALLRRWRRRRLMAVDQLSTGRSRLQTPRR